MFIAVADAVEYCKADSTEDDNAPYHNAYDARDLKCKRHISFPLSYVFFR